MTTPPPTSNLGSSRLLGTDDAQRAVDSLTRQVHNLERAVESAVRAFQSMAGTANRASTGTASGSRWNLNSNFPSNNGGQTRFSTSYGNQTPMSAGRSNGGGGSFGGGAGSLIGGRMAGGLALAAGAARGLVNYGNRTMSTNMQMDMFGTYSAMAGGVGNGGFRGANNTAMRAAFTNNANALSITDAAAGGYGIANIFGNAQYGGKANGGFTTGMRYAAGFGYANPTLGAAGTAQSFNQIYAPRSFYALGAYGIQNRQGGVPINPNNIAGDLTQRLWGRSAVSSKTMAAGFQQGGYAAASLQSIGSQAGWSQTTIQAVQNLMTARNTAINGGMSATKFDTLMQQANGGNRESRTSARAQLQKVGIGQSMFDAQKSLNATRVNRQEDILESLAPAFKDATEAVNHFSDALNSLLKNTGLDKLIGFGSGSLTPFSNALGGMGTGLGLGGGLLAARSLFGGGGGLAGMAGRLGGMGAGGAGGGAGLFTRLGGLFGGGGGAGGGLTATAGADGVFSVGGLGGMSALSMGGIATGAAALFGSMFGAGKYAGNPKNRKSHPILSTILGSWSGDPSLGGHIQPGSVGMLGTLAGTAGHLWNYGSRLLGNDGRDGGASTGSKKGKGNKGGGSAHGAGTANAASVIKFAEQQLGDPYQWGGTGPDAWDCSGLIQWAYKQAGVDIPRVSQDQQRIGKPVDTDKVQPGDLLFNGTPAHHVVMAIGNGKVIEAPHPGANVRIRSFTPGEFTNARRILGSVGNMSDISTDSTSATTQNDTAGNAGGNIGGGYGGTSELAAIMSALSGGGAGGSMPTSSQQSTSGGSSTDSGSDPAPASSNKISALQNYAKKLLKQYGWASEWNSFNKLVNSESSWNVKATNPSSGAYGLAQALPASKYNSAGSDWKTNGSTQLRWMMDYIKDRYGDPNKAWSFHLKNNWYASGAWSIDQDQAAQVHKGEMILPAKQAETVRQAITNTLTTGTSTSGKGGIVFEAGSIVVQPQGPMTQAEATTTAKMIVDAVTEDSRIKAMQKGY